MVSRFCSETWHGLLYPALFLGSVYYFAALFTSDTTSEAFKNTILCPVFAGEQFWSILSNVVGQWNISKMVRSELKSTHMRIWVWSRIHEESIVLYFWTLLINLFCITRYSGRLQAIWTPFVKQGHWDSSLFTKGDTSSPTKPVCFVILKHVAVPTCDGAWLLVQQTSDAPANRMHNGRCGMLFPSSAWIQG